MKAYWELYSVHMVHEDFLTSTSFDIPFSAQNEKEH